MLQTHEVIACSGCAAGIQETWRRVIEDAKARNEMGKRKYGRALTAMNGRDALLDAYEESLDLTVYLKQERDRREHCSQQILEFLDMLDVEIERCNADDYYREHMAHAAAMVRAWFGKLVSGGKTAPDGG
jgi:hypothetical protein